METLEDRRLLSAAVDPLASQPAPAVMTATTVAQAQPSVISTAPASGAANVALDVSITADLNLPNAGLNPATLSATTVQLFRTGDHAAVAAVVNTSGGGDSIICQPA